MAGALDGDFQISQPPLLERLILPLAPAEGLEALPVVGVGDTVRRGQVVAETSGDPPFPVHAPRAGVVQRIGVFPHPFLGFGLALHLSLDGTEEETRLEPITDPEAAGAEALLERLRLAGVLTLGPAPEPAFKVLRRARSCGADTLVLGTIESEPLVSCDRAILGSHPGEVLEGIQVLLAALGAKRALLALEPHQRHMAEILASKKFLHLRSLDLSFRMLARGYPHEGPLLARLLGVSPQQACVLPVATAYAAWDAALRGRPHVERVVTLAGAVSKPANVWLPFGAVMADALALAGSFLQDPLRVIAGGPMRGRAQLSLEVPVTAGTAAVLLQGANDAAPRPIDPCIRCGRCIEVCPVSISPALLTVAAEAQDAELLAEGKIERCTACGNCGYVCPANRPMTELLHVGRRLVRETEPIWAGPRSEVERI